MSPKQFGTCTKAAEGEALRWAVDAAAANKVGCFNRKYAEHASYFESNHAFLRELQERGDGQILFYDSINPDRLLFRAPVGRTMEEFLRESRVHGWPSFREQEVVWENVRVLAEDGETVSLDGTHLGHNLPDHAGNRYCINLVTIAGMGKEKGLQQQL